MEHTITQSCSGMFVIQKVKGDINRRLAMQWNAEAHACGKQLNIGRYLVDLTEAKNTDSIIDQFEYAYSDLKKAGCIDRSACIAVLVSPDDHSYDFMVTVAQNAGLYIWLFRDREQAIQFLESQTEFPSSQIHLTANVESD